MDHHARLVKSDSFKTYTPNDIEAELVYIDHERLGINEVDEVIRNATTTPLNFPGKLLVIRTTQITSEAQNALLKLFEEPPATSKFILAVTPSTQLFPTLLSRLQVEVENTIEVSTAWDLFLQAQIKDRIKQIESWQKQKDTDWLLDIQKGLRMWLNEGSVQPNKSLQLVVDRLNTRGAGNKMLLESLALNQQLQINK